VTNYVYKIEHYSLFKKQKLNKQKNISLFTDPQIVPNLWTSFFCWIQREIFWRMSVSKQLWGISLLTFFKITS